MLYVNPDQSYGTFKKIFFRLSWIPFRINAMSIAAAVGLLLVLPSWTARNFAEMASLEVLPSVQEGTTIAGKTAKYVILVSIDGLRPDAVTTVGREKLSNFYRFRDQGAWTDNARTDMDYTLTLPNHTTMLTARRVTGGTGHGWSTNSDPSPNETLHSNRGSYVASVFDVAHDNGLRTAAYVSKSKFIIYDQSYDESNGTEDLIGPDNGKDKIDIYRYSSESEALVNNFVSVMQTDPFHLSFLHLHDPDAHGHGTGWMRPDYFDAVEKMDGLLGKLFNLVENNLELQDNTVIIVTSDHGGTGYGHSNSSVAEHYMIPFYVWGKSVTNGVDLYTLNTIGRQNPRSSRTTYNTSIQPIRNGDAANLALSLLGFGNVPGSTINTSEQLLSVDGVGTQLPLAKFTVTPASGDGPLFVQFDASASTDIDGVIVAYDWDFGDGNSGSGETANHTYSAFGHYTATLSVTDDFGATAVATQTIMVTAANSVTVSFQDGAAPMANYSGTRDTKIRENAKDTFFGSDSDIEVDGDSDKAGLLKWDISSIPSGSTILSAEIILEISNGSDDTYEVYEIKQDWEEGETNWYQYRDGSTWQIEGANGSADRGSEILGIFDASDTGQDTIRLDQTAMTLIKGWADNPPSNYGFILLDYDDASSDGIDFHSRETSNVEDRPKLTITYTPPDDTSVDESVEIPGSLRLFPSYPNPFQNATTIQFEILEPTQVSLQIMDLLGRTVATLVEEPVNVGIHDVIFNAENLPSGVYLVRLHTDSRIQTSKVVLRR